MFPPPIVFRRRNPIAAEISAATELAGILEMLIFRLTRAMGYSQRFATASRHKQIHASKQGTQAMANATRQKEQAWTGVRD